MEGISHFKAIVTVQSCLVRALSILFCPNLVTGKTVSNKTKRNSTDGRVGLSYPEDPGSSSASAMLQCAFEAALL